MDTRTAPGRFYIGDVGTDTVWRQCRFCNGYADGQPGHGHRRHIGDCPVAEVERLRAAVATDVQALVKEWRMWAALNRGVQGKPMAETAAKVHEQCADELEAVSWLSEPSTKEPV